MKKFFLGLASLALLLLPLGAEAQSLNPGNGTGVTTYSSKAALNAQINSPTKWTYAAASGGIVNTTGVVMKAAAGGSKRIYVSSCQISNSGAAATEVLLNSGAGGTTIWRGWVGATASNSNIVFEQPPQTAANTLLEVALSSATTVAVRINCQGFTD